MANTFLIKDIIIPSVWNERDIEWLKVNYPNKGKSFCCQYLNRTEASIRKKASTLGLKINKDSEFFKGFQEKARASKVGKKRPLHSQKLKEAHARGDYATADYSLSGEKLKQYRKTHEHPRGMLGKKHKEETRLIFSKNAKENWEKITPELSEQRTCKILETRQANGNWNNCLNSSNAYSRTKSGKREDLGNTFFRSKAEANYARYLKYKGIKFEYEPKCYYFENIKRGTRAYTPDFYLIDLDVIVEFKGWLDPKSITKLKRFKKYYPVEFSKMKFVKQGLSKSNLETLLAIGFKPEQIEDFKEAESQKNIIPFWEF